MYYYCLWYDKLWGPSQRVVTLLHCITSVLLCIALHYKCICCVLYLERFVVHCIVIQV